MNIRTTEQLFDFLSAELAWRKKELAELRSLLELKSLPQNRQNVLIRSGVAMLYAHWEGFVRNAASAYVEFVAMQRLPYRELASNFVAIAIKDKLNDAIESNKATACIEITDFLITKLSERSSIPYKSSINTKSNLSSQVLREITTVLGIDFSAYTTKEKIIDEKLLKSRNNIAHGHYLIIDRDEYLELHNQVIEMMNLFRNHIDNSASMKSYCRI
jgi:hypothetical protein